MSTKGDTGQKVAGAKKDNRSKEKGKKRAKSSGRVDSMEASASKPSKHGKKKGGGATKKHSEKERAVSEHKSASNKPKSRGDKATARKGTPSGKKTKQSKSRKQGTKHGGKSSTGKRKSIFRKIYRRLWGSGSKEKKSKKKRSQKGVTKKPSPEEPTSSGQSAGKKPQGVVSELGEPTPRAPDQPVPEQQKEPEQPMREQQKEPEQPVPEQPMLEHQKAPEQPMPEQQAPEQALPEQKAAEQLAPEDKTPHDQKPNEKTETPGGAPAADASPQDAKGSVAHAGDAPGVAEKNKDPKTLDAEKDGAGKVGDKGVSELRADEPTTNAPVAERNGGLTSATKSGQIEDGGAMKGSPEVIKPAVQEGVADTHGLPTAKSDAQVQGGARPKTGWALGRSLEGAARPREDVIQPKRLPVKDDEKVAANGVDFLCSQVGAKHEGAVAVDWASLQDFLLPEFSAVF